MSASVDLESVMLFLKGWPRRCTSSQGTGPTALPDMWSFGGDFHPFCPGVAAVSLTWTELSE